jgi:GxxExxY protein
MGCGFLEKVYHECLFAEFQDRSIPFVSQPRVKIRYKGFELTHPYIPDFICFGKIIIEIKAVKTLLPEHQAQILNYLKAARMELGLLVNFGTHPKAQIQRYVSSTDRGRLPGG